MAGGCHPADSQRSRNSVHIALIAMSGVRAWSKEITEAGLTMPGFLERSEAIASLPSLALLTLAGMTPDPFEVSYHEVLDIHRLGELPDCDVAAIASYSAQIKDAYTLADRFRAVGVRVVLGGLHVTAVPDEAMEHADAVVVGEGELGWPDLLADLRAGRPIPLTPKYKVKPVAKVLAEIHAIKRIWPRPFIEFADDNTFVNRRHVKDLLRALAPERLRWFTESDIAIADDPELLELMRLSGCAEVLIGLESPNASAVEGVELR